MVALASLALTDFKTGKQLYSGKTKGKLPLFIQKHQILSFQVLLISFEKVNHHVNQGEKDILRE